MTQFIDQPVHASQYATVKSVAPCPSLISSHAVTSEGFFGSDSGPCSGSLSGLIWGGGQSGVFSFTLMIPTLGGLEGSGELVEVFRDPVTL